MTDAAEVRSWLAQKDETPRLEFKLRYVLSGPGNSKHKDELAKDLMALANTAGRTPNDAAYLIIGAGDKLKPDGTRDKVDVRPSGYSRKTFLDIVNDRSHRPLPNLNYTELEVDDNYYGIIEVPPSPFMHELSRGLDATSGSWRKGMVPIRRGDEVAPATFQEMELLNREKDAWHKPEFLKSEAHAEILEAYLSAFQAYCGDFPYVSVPGRPSQSFSHCYVEQWLKKLPPSKREPDTGDLQKFLPEQLLPEQLLSLPTHCVVTAGPGVGKSAMLHKVGLLASESCLKGANGQLVPVKVSAAGLSVRRGSLATSLYDQVSEELGRLLPTPLPRDFFSDLFFKGADWLLMIDGLDEVTDQVSRARLIRELTKHAMSTSPYRLMITSRPIPEIERLDEQFFAKYAIMPFERSQVLDFVNAWFQARQGSTPEDGRLFLAQVEESRVADLCTTPLLLTMAALVYERYHDLPRHRLTLYERFVAILLVEEESVRPTRKFFRSLWEQRYGREGDIVADELFNKRRVLLEHLASLIDYEFIDGAVTFSRTHGWIPPAIMDRDADWLRAQFETLLLRTGLMIQRGGEFAFIHKSLQDYLEASYLYMTNELEEWDSWATSLMTDTRREVLLFLLGLFSKAGIDVTAQVARIWEKGHLLIAGAALAEGLRIKAELVEQIVSNLLSAARRWERPPRPGPFELLQIVGKARQSSRAESGLLSLACSPRTRGHLRLAAAWALGSTGRAEPTTRAWLAVAHKAAQDPELRMSAYEVMDRGYPERSTKDAWEQLTSNQTVSPSFRLRAARAIAELGNAECLLSLSFDPGTPVVIRIKAAETLEELGLVEEAVHAWRSVTSYEGLGGARLTATRALGRLGRTHELLSIGFDNTLDPESRIEAARVLAITNLGEDAATILLSVAREATVDTSLRQRAVRALAELSRSDDLFRLASDEEVSATVRDRAVATLSVLGRSRELLLLVGDLDVNEHVRGAAAMALAKSGKLDALVIIASDAMTDEPGRRIVLEAISELGDERALLDLEERASKDMTREILAVLQDVIARMRMRLDRQSGTPSVANQR